MSNIAISLFENDNFRCFWVSVALILFLSIVLKPSNGLCQYSEELPTSSTTTAKISETAVFKSAATTSARCCGTYFYIHSISIIHPILRDIIY